MRDYLHILRARLTGNASRVAWLLALFSGTRPLKTSGNETPTSIISDLLDFDKLTIKKSLEELERFNLVELQRAANGQIGSVRLICYDEYHSMQKALEELKRHARG
jgi:hypothetical protein